MKGAYRVATLFTISFWALTHWVSAAPQIQFLPTETVVLGEPVIVKITGLEPNARVTLQAEAADVGDNIWRSVAVFQASGDGVVDVSRQAPLEGGYNGVDPAGPFWSMTQSTARPAAPLPTEANADIMVFTALVDGKAVASARHQRWYTAPDVISTPVMRGRTIGRFFKPSGSGPFPGLILVGGTSGGIGWQQSHAALLASVGYAALALPYFGMPGLPEYLEEVPLEYFGDALEWMKSEPSVDAGHIGVIGVSKGGELALLLGSTYPDLRAVVAFSPSSVVFQSVAPEWPNTSSWSKDGQPLPYVPYDIPDTYRESGRLSDVYEASLKNEEAVKTAAIPVERTNGAILVISGESDRMWPSKRMCEQIRDRLRSANFTHAFEHLSFPDAGHTIAGPGYSRMRRVMETGGTVEGNSRAMAQGWAGMLAFLEKHLKDGKGQ